MQQIGTGNGKVRKISDFQGFYVICHILDKLRELEVEGLKHSTRKEFVVR